MTEQKEYITDDDGIGCLRDYFKAALRREESAGRLTLLFEQQIGVIKSRHYNPDAIRQKAQEEVMDKFGILHGEAAIAFNEYLNDPEPVKSPEAKAIIKRAWEQAQKTSAERVLEPTDKDIAQSALYQCIRPQVRKMAHRMEQKFRLHDKERGDPFREFDDWKNFLFNRLKEERKEFFEAIGQGRPPSEVWNEAADKCNILTMIAVNYEREYWQVLRNKNTAITKEAGAGGRMQW